MPTTAEIVKLAEELLTKRYGGTQELGDIEVLSGSGTAEVLRARVVPSPFLQQRSLVIKYIPTTGDPIDDAALIREVVSYQFTTSLSEDVRPGPVLLAYDIDHRMLVISDSGDGETYAHLLEDTNPETRVRVLRNLGQALGRMHAGTAEKEADFDTLLARMLSKYPETEELQSLRDTALLSSIDSGMDILQRSGIEINQTIMDFAGEARRRLISGHHRAFTPFDLSPDNILLVERTQFLDYEWAGFRDATFDVACVIAGFPQFISARPISDDETEVFIDSWRREIRDLWPNVNNEIRLNARITTALIGWALASVSYLYYGSMNQAVTHLGGADTDEDSLIPDPAVEAAATAELETDFDIFASDVLATSTSEGAAARRDLYETFEALARYVARGHDPRYGDVHEFAQQVVQRLNDPDPL